MHTYHIHINGLVQGVGFRPYVCRLAERLDIKGWVSNTNDGVHIKCTASDQNVKLFYATLTSTPPPNAIITHHHIENIAAESFNDFSIRQSDNAGRPDMLLTPDIALCDACKEELFSQSSKRYRYAFTTCLQCGPRYSIIKALPYDRENTSMQHLAMCKDCNIEYNDIHNRRHYSQTNSCSDCAIPMHLHTAQGTYKSTDPEKIIGELVNAIQGECIVAVKGIGGYLLLCDATNETVISKLRSRKKRPSKPFAIMYPDCEMATDDLVIRPYEKEAMLGKTAPIVLCRLKKHLPSGLCSDLVAPGLDKIGAMLPYSPLLLLIAQAVGKPMIATSANISGAPIIYKDDEAIANLFEVADLVLSFEREILSPQDDSVMQFSSWGQKIILRRSRGLAPNYFPNPFPAGNKTLLATGAELKAAFALQDKNNMYISQYLGDQETVESQNSYAATLQHMQSLLQFRPDRIIVDKHPGYSVSQYGKKIAETSGIPVTAIQHHKAHFGAVLAENDLMNSDEPVLGFIWDGTGYGDDEQIWGSELFVFENRKMKRLAHLKYFPQLLGDKMSREPRLSALSLLKALPEQQEQIRHLFTDTEWKYYQQLLEQPIAIQTSSMGRFLDGIAAMLGICGTCSYEGEAVMQLEALARNSAHKPSAQYAFGIHDEHIDWKPFLSSLLFDLVANIDKAVIAWKVFFSLAMLVDQLSRKLNINKVAFSGGVFQNALLNDILIERHSYKRKLFFHRQLSPNDECIGFGQLACYILQQEIPKERNGLLEKLSTQNLLSII